MSYHTRMRAALILLGAAVSLSSLWLGSWACGQLAHDHWASFPSFVTAFLGFIAGIPLVAIGTAPRSIFADLFGEDRP